MRGEVCSIGSRNSMIQILVLLMLGTKLKYQTHASWVWYITHTTHLGRRSMVYSGLVCNYTTHWVLVHLWFFSYER